MPHMQKHRNVWYGGKWRSGVGGKGPEFLSWFCYQLRDFGQIAKWTVVMAIYQPLSSVQSLSHV